LSRGVRHEEEISGLARFAFDGFVARELKTDGSSNAFAIHVYKVSTEYYKVITEMLINYCSRNRVIPSITSGSITLHEAHAFGEKLPPAQIVTAVNDNNNNNKSGAPVLRIREEKKIQANVRPSARNLLCLNSLVGVSHCRVPGCHLTGCWPGSHEDGWVLDKRWVAFSRLFFGGASHFFLARTGVE
jgi:hypothetical protein